MNINGHTQAEGLLANAAGDGSPLQHILRPGRGPRASLRRWAVTQFGRPSGFWGGVAGAIMANRTSNVERNRWTAELLDVQPGERVLEIGYGPGLALEHLAHRVGPGLVVGIDHSDVMLRQAARRNAEAIAQGRMVLMLGSVARLPATSRPYDKVMAVNNVMFWDQPALRLREVGEQMRPGGMIALTTQPRGKGVTAVDTHRSGDKLLALLEQAGFTGLHLEFRALRPVPAVCAIGVR